MASSYRESSHQLRGMETGVPMNTHALRLEDVVDESTSEAGSQLNSLGMVGGLALLFNMLLVRVRSLYL